MTCLLHLGHHHHVDAKDPCLERKRFKLLEEQVPVREVTLTEFLPLRELDFGVGVLPESLSDLLYELLVGGIDLVPIHIPSQFSCA